MTDKLLVEHSKYDLLRTTLLLNSVRLKEKCNATYDNVVYFYKYNNLDLVIKEKQNVFSNLLMELKQAKGDKIMLIPIAADNDLTSINILLDKYNISQKEIPVIIINEKTKITDLQRIEELEKYLK
jgi:hypothetical protein